jgi:tetratricopeptide (TPR) repeat protein
MNVLTCHRLGRGLVMVGRPGEAVEPAQRGLERLLAMGETAYAPTSAYILADALYQEGRNAEAEEFAVIARDTAAPGDYDGQQGWRMALSKVLARRGQIEEGERLAREAIEILEPTDTVNARGEARISLAEVLWAAGRLDEATEAARSAKAEFDRKGNVVMAGRVESFLTELREH